MLILLIGPSGSGKTTLEELLMKDGFSRVVSYTTREKRPNEVDGVNYHFVCKENFSHLDMLETCTYKGEFYGSPKVDSSKNYVLVCEADGMLNIKALCPDAVSVYLDAKEEVRRTRLVDRFDAEERLNYDRDRFKDVAACADIIVDASKTPEEIKNEVYTKGGISWI